MNHLFIPLFLMLFFTSGFSQKLTIINQNYEEAKVESQKQNKLLLIDFYTTWCGPCKAIEKRIFESSSISNEMSKSFIVLRYDAEKDEEHHLSLKHHIGSYPATVVLNPNQFAVDKLYGLGGEDKDLEKNYQAFLAETIAKNKQNEFIKGVSNSTKDLTYPKFYEDYVYRKNTNLDEKALNDFWSNNKDWLSELSFIILTYFNGTDEVESFFLKNQQKYEELYGKTDVGYLKGKMTFMKFAKAVDAKDRKLYDAAVSFFKEIFGEFENKSLESWEQNMLIAENRWNDALQFFLTRQKKDKLGDDYTDNFCSTVYRKSNDTRVLKECVGLMKNVTDKNPEPSYLNTYAFLLYKTGNLKLSKTVLEKAVKIGKAKKEDTQTSEKWLKTVQDKISQNGSKKGAKK